MKNIQNITNIEKRSYDKRIYGLTY